MGKASESEGAEAGLQLERASDGCHQSDRDVGLSKSVSAMNELIRTKRHTHWRWPT